MENFDWNYIIVLVIGLVGGYLVTNAADGIRLVKKWGDANPKYHFAVDFAIEMACTFAEKLYASGDGKEKLRFAVEYVVGMAKQYGITLDEQTIIDAINKYVEEVINAGRKDSLV